MTSKLAHSKKAMVTSPHVLASQAGLEILRSGGNAIEAALTVASCLAVTYPHFTGFGGDSFLILSNAQGQVQTISGIGQAAQNTGEYVGAIPTRGARSMLTTAATVDAFGKAFEISRTQFGGKLTWDTLLSSAITLAREGFPVSQSQRFWLEFRKQEIANLPGVSRLFMPNGVIPEIGARIVQPQLATTIEMLAKNGHRDFYEGELARRIAQGLSIAGSPLKAGDLAKTAARVEPPLTIGYRGGTLVSLQPPTQGVATLEIMGILNKFDFSKIMEGSADYYHVLVEAVKQAFIDRDSVADPEFTSFDPAALLTDAHLSRGAQMISMKQALAWPHKFQTGVTVFVAAADEYGNAVSLLSTIYFDWGSGVAVGDTGLLWHNRGASFSLNPVHPNRLEPGKRPFHTLNPGMYVKAGKAHILYGTQGADGQPQTLATILTRLIDYEMDPWTALSKPRFLLGKTFSNSEDSLKLEVNVGADVVAELTRRGHHIATIAAQSPLAGHSGTIVIDPDTGFKIGAHDPRSDGRALGL